MKENKKILFVCPKFFEYHTIIKRGMTNKGYNVDYINSVPTSIYQNIPLSSLKQKMTKRTFNKYFTSLYNDDIKDYDHIIIINPQALPHNIIEKWKRDNPNARFVSYLWDDVAVYPNMKDYFKYFDKNFSYNILESEKYNINFLPFFFEKYTSALQMQKKNDIFIIGTAHLNRIQMYERLKSQNPTLNIKSYLFCKFPPIIKFLKGKISLNTFIHLKYVKKNYYDYIKELNSSFATLEIPRTMQTAPTTRTYEALSNGCKLITTNTNIVHYPIYDENNVMILGDDLKIDVQWLHGTFNDYNIEVQHKLSLSNWIDELIGD